MIEISKTIEVLILRLSLLEVLFEVGIGTRQILDQVVVDLHSVADLVEDAFRCEFKVLLAGVWSSQIKSSIHF